MTKEAQAAMEKACELFILELTVLAWTHAPLSHDEGAQQFHALTVSGLMRRDRYCDELL